MSLMTVWSPRVCAGVLACAALGVLATASAAEPSGQGLTVQRAMSLAAERAPLIEADLARISSAAFEARRAGALPDPMLTVGIENLTITGPTAGQLGADEMTMRRIGISQDWPGRAKRQARVAQADARYSEALLSKSVTRLAVERAAGDAWVERWAAETQVALLDQLHDELDRGVRVSEARLRGGEGSVSDVLAAKNARADHQNEMTMAMASLQASRVSLARWVGDAEAVPLALLSVDVPPVAAQSLRGSLERLTVIQLWDARSRTAESAVALASAEKHPDLSFGLSYGARSGFPDMVSFEVGIGLPLFASRRQDLGVSARRADLEAVTAEREGARRTQSEELERELALWQGQAEAIARYRKTLLPLARDRVRVALAAYSGGAEIEPWLAARRDEVETRVGYAKALADQGKRWVLFATLLPRETH